MQNAEKDFLEKMEKHKGVVFKISKMYMDNFDDQKDLFQEITFQAWKAYPSFEGRSEFSTWLYRIALNTAIIFLKSIGYIFLIDLKPPTRHDVALFCIF